MHPSRCLWSSLQLRVVSHSRQKNPLQIQQKSPSILQARGTFKVNRKRSFLSANKLHHKTLSNCDLFHSSKQLCSSFSVFFLGREHRGEKERKWKQTKFSFTQHKRYFMEKAIRNKRTKKKSPIFMPKLYPKIIVKELRIFVTSVSVQMLYSLKRNTG